MDDEDYAVEEDNIVNLTERNGDHVPDIINSIQTRSLAVMTLSPDTLVAYVVARQTGCPSPHPHHGTC
jgi:hypothetical protein